jgi:hypothetical protein
MSDVSLTVGANATLDGLLVLQESVNVSISNLRECEIVILEGNSVNNVVPESCIARGVLVFVLAHEEALAATCAAIYTCILVPPVLACEGALCTISLGDVIGVR